jgi:hypothetical protein
MGNKLCDCKYNQDLTSHDIKFFTNVPISDNKPIRLQTLKEDSSTNDMNKDDDNMKIEVIDSYDIENNVYNIDYIKSLIKLQRGVKRFLALKRYKVSKKCLPPMKVIQISRKSIGNVSISNSLISHDMQSVISRHSSKISKIVP